MLLLRILTGLHNGARGVRHDGGMLLVMMAMAGLLTRKAAKRKPTATRGGRLKGDGRSSISSDIYISSDADRDPGAGRRD
jgi:hypothetical protein